MLDNIRIYLIGSTNVSCEITWDCMNLDTGKKYHNAVTITNTAVFSPIHWELLKQHDNQKGI
jgi:hypothetical protein